MAFLGEALQWVGIWGDLLEALNFAFLVIVVTLFKGQSDGRCGLVSRSFLWGLEGPWLNIFFDSIFSLPPNADLGVVWPLGSSSHCLCLGSHCPHPEHLGGGIDTPRNSAGLLVSLLEEP